ncbi:hypothetical protein DFP72DRAFT_553208 [Ephemerocybe angulata]|uniref:Arrestin-like N-terminal domain-containing protein n=1 Tax=Ephemerocybe angulata TaxID=980116 RepID=A0A8H6HLS9_9AGAR|nr:hypothetical protein DFP72DRAFT_553208 [Tulosesus angulatus]
MDTRNPPRYSTLSLATLPVYPTARDLDISSINDTRQSFEFCIENTSISDGRQAWATLSLLSTVPPGLQRPRYRGGESVEGTVTLDLKRPRTITSISVLLRGRMVTSSLSDGSHLFLEVAHPIWDSTMGVPAPLGGQELLSPASPTRGNTSGKFNGHYEFPFSFAFPIEFQNLPVATKHPNRENVATTYLTPQTVLERGINADITYEVVLKIATGGLFKTKHRITATVLYVPLIRPPPLPPLRASAYLNATYLVGPEDDPTGWQMLPKMYFRVTTAHSPSFVDVECSAYVANPTAYTRGTVIPCYLICRTRGAENATARSATLLQDFVAQQCVALTLFQRVHYHEDPRQAISSNFRVGHDMKVRVPKDERASHTERCGVAVWWPPTMGVTVSEGDHAESSQSPARSSCLEGEIHLDLGHLPSCETPFFQVSHSVSTSLNPTQSLVITTLSDSQGSGTSKLPEQHDRTNQLSRIPVRIVTAHAEAGPSPTPFTPAPPRRQKDASFVQDVQYNVPREGL